MLKHILARIDYHTAKYHTLVCSASNLFLTIIESGSPEKFARRVPFWHGLSSRVQTADFSGFCAVKRKQRNSVFLYIKATGSRELDPRDLRTSQRD